MLISESFVVADWTDPGERLGPPIAPLRLHGSDDEAWYVLEGRLGFTVGDEEPTAGRANRSWCRGDTAHQLEPVLGAGAVSADHDTADPPADPGAARR